MKKRNLLDLGVRTSFWMGAMFMGALIGLLQDLRGKEAYLRTADKYWINSAICLPFEIAFVILTVVVYRWLRYKAKQIDEKVNLEIEKPTLRAAPSGGDEFGDWPGFSARSE